MRSGGTIWILALVVLFAGCVNAPGADVETASTEAEGGHGVAAALTAPVDGGLDLTAMDCSMAGGVAQNPYPKDTEVGEPEPFDTAETTEYLGLPVEETGWFLGNAHVAFMCHEWTLNGNHKHHPHGGWVGLAVEAPPFESIEPATRNFLVSTIATQDPTLSNLVQDVGFHVYAGKGMLMGGNLGPTGFTRAVIETAGDGIYETEFLHLEKQDPSWDHIRLWLILDWEDGQLHPAALDLWLDGGETFLGTGRFSHSLTGDHPPVNRADVPSGAMAFQGFDLTARLTVLPEVMEDIWSH